MIRPTAGQCYESPGASPRLSIKPRDVVIQLGVIGFRQRGGAEIKRSLDGCHQLVLAFRPLQFFHLRARHIADIRTEEVIAIGNVRGEMAECHLLGGGLIVELVGRHFFDGTDCVLGATGKHLAQYVGDGVLGFLGESGAGEKQDQSDEFHAGLRNFASRIILEGGTCRLERHLLHFFDSRSTLA